MQHPVKAPKGLEDRYIQIKAPRKFTALQDMLRKVKPKDVPAIWYPTPPSSAGEENVLLYFFGGGYVLGDITPASVQPTASVLCPALEAKVLAVGYRLASHPCSCFPSQLVDAIAAYHYLLDQAVSAKRIIITGDSAGANLALALLRYIEASSGLLPRPAAALLASPWVNLSVNVGAIKSHRNYHRDIVRAEHLVWGASALTADGVPAAAEPYLSPISHPFETTVPIWVEAGNLEVLFDEIKSFVEAMQGIAGNHVELYEVPTGCHDSLWAGKLLGFGANTDRSIEQVKKFLLKHHVM